MTYLYGASVQGIQNIIFETNKLKEIGGASSIVEGICKGFPQEFFPDLGLKDEDFIIRAAGNIRFACSDEEVIKKVVKNFPMVVAKKIPGITISQAVLKLDEGIKSNSLRKLDEELKIQRNCLIKTAPVGLSVAKRAPRTGKPACKRKGDDLIDFATDQKQNSQDKDRFRELLFKDSPDVDGISLCLPQSEDEISVDAKKNWIAICHADGNGLGQILIDIEEVVKDLSAEKIQETYRRFSCAIESANEQALQQAFNNIVVDDARNTIEKEKPQKEFVVPFRPILLGGDDITFICRGDLAIPFLQKYMAYFEECTKEKFKTLCEEIPALTALKEGLTICAGVAFIKKNYPFHYGYHLAEDLCAYAKKVSKKNKEEAGKILSSLAFHKVHSSFHVGYENIEQNELQVGTTSLQFGPYAIKENTVNIPCLEHLLLCAKELQKNDAPKSGLRKWLSELDNLEIAKQLLCRTVEIAKEKNDFNAENFSTLLQKLNADLKIDKLIVDDKTPVYDFLTLTSLG